MSEGKIAAAMVCVFFVATTAGTWAAWNSYITPAIAMVSDSEIDNPPRAAPVQSTNASTKSDRLAALKPAFDTTPVATTEPAPERMTYSLAAVSATAVEPPKPRIESRIEPRAEPRIEASKPAVATPPEKPKRTESRKLLLDDAQIASLRTRLKLTPTQEEFWPAVEVTLRDMVHAHARKSRNGSVAPQIDVNSPEVQQLINAAVPLIMRLSEEQKREVRALARIIGLETVASKI